VEAFVGEGHESIANVVVMSPLPLLVVVVLVLVLLLLVGLLLVRTLRTHRRRIHTDHFLRRQ